jgi:flagellin-like protein
MKGISTVIAVILMLMITIALVSVASGFIFGIFGARTAVVLAEAAPGYCATGAITNALTYYVRNDGTSTSGTLTWANHPGNPSTITGCTFSPTTLTPGGMSTVNCSRASAGAGYWRVLVSAPGVPAVTLSAYCAG